jgi:uncharacterized protein RhaS with RHS repeats
VKLGSGAVFREFTDTDADGLYDQVSPADEYRTLTRLGAGLGWTLTGLDGAVTTYRPDGRWESTADRNGNLTQGTYDGLNRLTAVSFPEGRSENGFGPDHASGVGGTREAVVRLGRARLDEVRAQGVARVGAKRPEAPRQGGLRSNRDPTL